MATVALEEGVVYESMMVGGLQMRGGMTLECVHSLAQRQPVHGLVGQDKRIQGRLILKARPGP